MKFKRFNLNFRKNGYFYGAIVTDKTFNYNLGDEHSLVFFVGYSEETKRFSDLCLRCLDENERPYNFRWAGNRFLPAEGNTEINPVLSGLVKDLSEGEWEAFTAEMKKFEKIITKEVESNVIRDLKNNKDDFTRTCEFQTVLTEYKEKAEESLDPKSKALVKSLFENDCISNIDLMLDTRLDAIQRMEIFFGITSELSREALEVYANPKFNSDQMSQLCTSLTNKIPLDIVKVYADVKFSAAQMMQIRAGFENGLSVNDVGLYAQPHITPEQMSVYRQGYRLGITRDELEKVPLIEPGMMFSLIKNEAEEKDKQRFLDSGSEYLGLLSSTGEKDKFRVSNLQDLSFNTQFEIWRALEREKKNVSTLEGSLEDVLSELRADERNRQVGQER